MKKAIIDIDGVLNNYPETQINFYNDRYGKEYGYVSTLHELKEKLSYSLYSKMKEEYRKSDYKHNATPKENAKEMLNTLRAKGYLIYITTARKLFSLNQLEKTIMWLRNNDLVYDYIYCSQKKDFTILEKFGKIDLVVEDNCDNVSKIKDINGRADYFVVNNSDNQNDVKTNAYRRVNSLKEIITFLEEKK